jgi:hypothetical protein
MQLGDSSEIIVGADVRAIGHPVGNDWSYTKGISASTVEDMNGTLPPGRAPGSATMKPAPRSCNKVGGAHESGKLVPFQGRQRVAARLRPTNDADFDSRAM